VNRPDLVDFAFAALVIAVGVTPILTVPGWQGYGPKGEFSCSCGPYYVRFSDSTHGGDKPHVYTTYQGFQVDVIEVSDEQSTINGLNIHSTFNTTRNLTGGGLLVEYTSPGVNFTKQVSVSDGVVYVDFKFTRDVTAVLTFWRWYYSSIGSFDRPVTRYIATNVSVPFTFFGQGAIFNATLSSFPSPVSAVISGVEGGGLNKMALEFQGRNVHLTIRVAAVKALAGAGVIEVASSNEAFPVLAVVVASGYLVTRAWVREKK
jgi:hypothetical protein